MLKSTLIKAAEAGAEPRRAGRGTPAERAALFASLTNLAEHGVSHGHWSFLRVLWEEDGLSQRELSTRVGMMEPTTVIALRGMEKAGLVRRSRSSADRRVTRH